MKKIHPLDLFLWTVRRNEKDVVNLYNSLSGVMKLATGGDMLNFGLWDDKTHSPLSAQQNLTEFFGKIAQLEPHQKIIDVGCGLASPAILWCDKYFSLEIICVDINFGQLNDSRNTSKNQREKISFVNATARALPFEDGSVDRVLALESAQHFKPFKGFVSESFRVLRKDGILALAIPVVEKPTSFIRLGILAMTWSSEHYGIDFVTSILQQEGFIVESMQKIGQSVYDPLSDYYIKNRESLRPKILEQYPSYVEKILFNSLHKMKKLSQEKTIDYILVICTK